MKKPYKLATCEQTAPGFILLLDGKPARTPGDKPMLLPNAALGDAIAREWHSQGEVLRKELMSLTQIAIITIDHAAEQSGKVVAELVSYAETDLICYRAGDNPVLLARQAELLDPILAWAEEHFDIALKITDGVMPVKQPAGNKMKLAEALAEYDSWKLAALMAAVGPLGSLIIALALVEGRIDAEVAFTLAHLEEIYETEKWGRDEEKEKRMAGLKAEIEAVGRFLSLLLSSIN